MTFPISNNVHLEAVVLLLLMVIGSNCVDNEEYPEEVRRVWELIYRALGHDGQVHDLGTEPQNNAHHLVQLTQLDPISCGKNHVNLFTSFFQKDFNRELVMPFIIYYIDKLFYFCLHDLDKRLAKNFKVSKVDWASKELSARISSKLGQEYSADLFDKNSINLFFDETAEYITEKLDPRIRQLVGVSCKFTNQEEVARESIRKQFQTLFEQDCLIIEDLLEPMMNLIMMSPDNKLDLIDPIKLYNVYVCRKLSEFEPFISDRVYMNIICAYEKKREKKKKKKQMRDTGAEKRKGRKRSRVEEKMKNKGKNKVDQEPEPEPGREREPEPASGETLPELSINNPEVAKTRRVLRWLLLRNKKMDAINKK